MQKKIIDDRQLNDFFKNVKTALEVQEVASMYKVLIFILKRKPLYHIM